MPMRWTPDKDHILLLKLLETHDISVDTKKIAAAWPTNADADTPTARAITERLVKIRQLSKAAGNNANFAVSKPAASTPAKPARITTPSSRQDKGRARVAPRGDGSEEDDEESPSKRVCGAAEVKTEEALGWRAPPVYVGSLSPAPRGGGRGSVVVKRSVEEEEREKGQGVPMREGGERGTVRVEYEFEDDEDAV